MAACRSLSVTTIQQGSSRRVVCSSSRQIPKRGQVKARIAISLARSLSAIFSPNNSSSRQTATHIIQATQVHVMSERAGVGKS
ncbi:hypothetical protein ACHQM5_002973 [Ranunculus cassubicifolius]